MGIEMEMGKEMVIKASAFRRLLESSGRRAPPLCHRIPFLSSDCPHPIGADDDGKTVEGYPDLFTEPQP